MSDTYFERNTLKARARALEKTAGVPAWLPRVLERLADEGHRFPPEADEDRFVVEFVYPL